MVAGSKPQYEEETVSKGLLHYITYPVYVIGTKLGFAEKILPEKQIYLSKTQELKNHNMQYMMYLRGIEFAERRKFHDRSQELSRSVSLAVNKRTQISLKQKELEAYCNQHDFEMTDFELPPEMLDLEERAGKLYRALNRPGVRR